MKNKKFIISIILIAAINIFGIAVWLFVFLGTEKERSAISDLRQNIDANERRLANIRSLEKFLEDSREDAEKIEAIFLDAENIVKFIEELESLNQKTGTALAIRGVGLPAGSAKEPSFQFQITGPFRDVFQFLILAENLPYQISFEKVFFTRPFTKEGAAGKETDKNWTADFEIKLLSYDAG